jgi:serine/threonine protein kinase
LTDLFGESKPSIRGSVYWMAPEGLFSLCVSVSSLFSPRLVTVLVIRQSGTNLSADVWSLGCVVTEMWTGKPPFAQARLSLLHFSVADACCQFPNSAAALYHIASSDEPPAIPVDLSADGRDFLRLCLQRDPTLRPSTEVRTGDGGGGGSGGGGGG